MEEKMYANIIVKNILSQVYEEGNMHIMLDEVIYHHVRPGTVQITDILYDIKNGFKRLNMTTRGW